MDRERSHCDGHGATSTFARISLALDSVLAKLRTPNPEEFRIGLAEGYACLNSRQDWQSLVPIVLWDTVDQYNTLGECP